MAGRQHHRKSVYSATTPIRYAGKMYALFKNYIGDSYAKDLAEAMLKQYEGTFKAYYTKVHLDPQVQDYLNSNVGSALHFLAMQLINEFISSVLLTRNETAGYVYHKYKDQGLPPEVIVNLMRLTTNILAESIPAFYAFTGGVPVTNDNVIRVVDAYVLSGPPAPRSYGGKMAVSRKLVVPERYAGTATFSNYGEAETALEQMKKELMVLLR